MRSFISFIAILFVAFMINTSSAFAGNAADACTDAGGTWFPQQPGNSQSNGECIGGGDQGGDGGNGGNGGNGGQGGQGGYGQGGDALALQGQQQGQIGINSSENDNTNTANGGSANQGQSQFGVNDLDSEIKNTNDNRDTNTNLNSDTNVNGQGQDQGQGQLQGQGQAQGQAMEGNTDIFVSDDDTFVEAPKLPVNSAAASIGGSCNSGLAVSFKDVSASIGEGSVVCDLLAIARGYAALGDLDTAKSTLKEAREEVDFRRSLLKVRFVLTFGLLK